MKKDISVSQIRTNFSFIQQIFKDTFHTDCYLYTYPYDDLSKIDHGFRKMVWNNYPQPQLTSNIGGDSDNYRMLVIHSTLGFHNIIAYTSLDEYPDFISIGPFRTDELSSDSYLRLINKNSMTPDFISMVQQFYRALPLVRLNDVISTLQHLISFFLPDFSDVTPYVVNYSEEKHEIVQTEENTQKYSTRFAEEYSCHLNAFLQALVSGHMNDVSDTLKKVMLSLGITSNIPVLDIRKFAYDLNSLCKGKLITASFPAIYVLGLYDSYAETISSCSNPQKLLQLISELSRKYCLLVKNYGFANYSYLVKNTITYIMQNLTDDDLCLASIAENLHRNASSLSGIFSKETGISVTEWIHQERIKKALQYFNTTELSVADVASKVGINDLSYFSKLFKKQVGKTPTYYRKMMRRSNI